MRCRAGAAVACERANARERARASVRARIRAPATALRAALTYTFLPPVILVAIQSLSRRERSFASHDPMMRSVAPSGLSTAEGMGYCVRVSVGGVSEAATRQPRWWRQALERRTRVRAGTLTRHVRHARTRPPRARPHPHVC